MAELNLKQQRFVQEYLCDLNAKQAAIRAGYSKRTADVQGSRLLSHASVREAIAAGNKKRASRLELTAEKVLTDITRIAKKAEAAAEFNAALRGHELLGKHLKLFTEKHEHGGLGGGPVLFQITSSEADL